MAAVVVVAAAAAVHVDPLDGLLLVVAFTGMAPSASHTSRQPKPRGSAPVLVPISAGLKARERWRRLQGSDRKAE